MYSVGTVGPSAPLPVNGMECEFDSWHLFCHCFAARGLPFMGEEISVREISPTNSLSL